jgi:hypothetical protein
LNTFNYLNEEGRMDAAARNTEPPAMLAEGTGPPALTRGEMRSWYLRNLDILMGVFFPSVAALGVMVDCAVQPPANVRGPGLGRVLAIVIVLGIPVAMVGSAHLLLVLFIARRRPWVARMEAAALLPGLALAFGGVEWVRAYPLGMLVLVVGGAGYAAMLRLNPRERLDGAVWIWLVLPALLLLDGVRVLPGVG